MLDFFQSNWKDLLEIIVSVVIGFLGGVTYQKNKIKNVSKIKGSNNVVFQEGKGINDKK